MLARPVAGAASGTVGHYFRPHMRGRSLEQPLRGNERRSNEQHGHPDRLLKNRLA